MDLRGVNNSDPGQGTTELGPPSISTMSISAEIKAGAWSWDHPVFTAPGSNAILAPPRTLGVELEAKF